MKMKMIKSAVISKDGFYRYRLIRIWDPDRPILQCVLHNPSTADADKDDATIRRLIGFARLWGYGGIHVYNLLAFRATHPKDLHYTTNPAGLPKNREYLEELEGDILCAWGNTCWFHICREAEELLRQKCSLWCLGKNKSGNPRHPVRLPYSTPLVAY